MSHGVITQAVISAVVTCPNLSPCSLSSVCVGVASFALYLFFLLTCSEFHNTLSVRPDVTALHCFESGLIVGTARGDLIVFRVDNTPSNSPTHKVRLTNGCNHQPSRTSYQHLASYNCGHSPVMSIYTSAHEQVPAIFSRESRDDASIIHIMAVLGSSSTNEPSECLLKAFELIVSSQFSPCSTPSFSSSHDGNFRKLTPRRLSLVHTNSHHFLPLQS